MQTSPEAALVESPIAAIQNNNNEVESTPQISNLQPPFMSPRYNRRVSICTSVLFIHLIVARTYIFLLIFHKKYASYNLNLYLIATD